MKDDALLEQAERALVKIDEGLLEVEAHVKRVRELIEVEQARFNRRPFVQEQKKRVKRMKKKVDT